MPGCTLLRPMVLKLKLKMLRRPTARPRLRRLKKQVKMAQLKTLIRHRTALPDVIFLGYCFDRQWIGRPYGADGCVGLGAQFHQ